MIAWSKPHPSTLKLNLDATLDIVDKRKYYTYLGYQK